MNPTPDNTTVFWITCNSSASAASRAALAAQTCAFRLEVIDHVAPMSAAFQMMLDRCVTPYFVQVDDDMVLRSFAVERLVTQLGEAPRDVAMVCHPLWDRHLGRSILGLKAYRHGIFRRYPYRDVRSCEMDQLSRLAADHYRSLVIDPVQTREDDPVLVGYHGTHYTPEEAFERYSDLARKQRLVGHNDWVLEWPRRFLDRLVEQGGHYESADLWAFLGLVSGLAYDGPTGEKDWRRNMPDFAELSTRLVSQPCSANVYMTPLCNQKCRWCRRTIRHGDDDGVHFEAKHATRLLEVFPTLRTACLAGFGEPLLAPELPEVAAVFLDRGLYVSLITNGVLVSDQLHRLPWQQFGYVNISLNEADPAAHADVCGVPGAFQSVVRGLDELVGLGDVNVGVSFVAHSGNWRRIPDWLAFASDHGARFATIVNLVPHHETQSAVANEAFWRLVLNDESSEYLAALPGFQALADELGITVNHWPVLVSRRYNPRRCRLPWTTIGADGVGRVGGCGRVRPPAEENGNYFLGNTWETNPQLVRLRRTLSGGGPLPPECTLCFGSWKVET